MWNIIRCVIAGRGGEMKNRAEQIVDGCSDRIESVLIVFGENVVYELVESENG